MMMDQKDLECVRNLNRLEVLLKAGANFTFNYDPKSAHHQGQAPSLRTASEILGWQFKAVMEAIQNHRLCVVQSSVGPEFSVTVKHAKNGHDLTPDWYGDDLGNGQKEKYNVAASVVSSS